MANYRRTAGFIPYRVTADGAYAVFLQRRSKDAPRLPDFFGFFGGGIEGDETPKEALLREVKEELDYVAEDVTYIGAYRENSLHAFCHRAPDNFEQQITILEGDYGQWFRKEQYLAEEKLIDLDKIILADVFEKLTNSSL
ncbi:MAG: hypothetical protein G01um101448_1135 [Parcubacteria group bacterium Gr01-1014_48]|nr:MAG: hypothetical protein Greene041614_1025 [Parcubacteria group bacterium Greene0416_14]TSC71572.1 MAG: hypothetical protein G01um101448_1135 [Parcubacteria group bacterium Gr01-1014_48]TSC99799.1 MAG: hypothetical protein Greene101415_1082 [Parcubacteria group bacterium Greene1014_15]TSD07838.1 MAG: hypothetical protein Greene07144_672 [Parcubacteria group bacterium Greene0714_4]